MIKQELKNLIGKLPAESGFKARARFHQGWWRAFVLGEDQGDHPIRKNERIGSTIRNGETSNKNFLSPSIANAVHQTIQERSLDRSGIIEQDRLFNNLLSSQPLCFNFFGLFKSDTDLALRVLRQFYPNLTTVKRIMFEYAPMERYTNDNSAFDVAIEVTQGNQTGLIGLECKYTDSFSSMQYDQESYRQIFSLSKAFDAAYDSFIASKYNQLFRNQLIAEALIQNKKCDFVLTGLFCHQDDKIAQDTGTAFMGMLENGNSRFKIITYRDFVEAIQRLEISWQFREYSMLLWARYIGAQLSAAAYD
jgi:hypothetical protein